MLAGFVVPVVPVVPTSALVSRSGHPREAIRRIRKTRETRKARKAKKVCIVRWLSLCSLRFTGYAGGRWAELEQCDVVTVGQELREPQRSHRSMYTQITNSVQARAKRSSTVG